MIPTPAAAHFDPDAPDAGIDPAGIYIVGMGAQTPIGRSALASAAAVRCAISAYAEHPYMIDKHGEPMIVCRADWLDDDLPWADRLASLADEAAAEAWRGIAFPGDVGSASRGDRAASPLKSDEVNIWHAGPRHEPIPFCIEIAVGDPPPERERADYAVAQRIRRELGLNDKTVIGVHTGGHAAGMAALDAACAKLRSGSAALALIGGVDSYIDSEYLEAIDYSGRLHSVNYSWGITPGEAAAFILLATGAATLQLELRPLGQLAGIGVAQEAKTMGTKTVCIGEGLTAAYKQALGGGAAGKIQHSYCDMNGETYRADEFAFAVLRTRQFFEDAGSFTTPADCWGDVGAASAPLLMTLPLSAWARGYGKGATKLVWCSSAEKVGRGAVVVRAVPDKANESGRGG